jgi:hypothetical protein
MKLPRSTDLLPDIVLINDLDILLFFSIIFFPYNGPFIQEYVRALPTASLWVVLFE